uniref:Putative DNA polymerase sigma-like protein n=1 Tax=Trypanosoma vivax (strain Y486) TaxID=1055687 RepID=G0TXU2_TRYVY|nr:putative DNA polymerase sigma-like protein [Trypanosoma vivax Y486]
MPVRRRRSACKRGDNKAAFDPTHVIDGSGTGVIGFLQRYKSSQRTRQRKTYVLRRTSKNDLGVPPNDTASFKTGWRENRRCGVDLVSNGCAAGRKRGRSQVSASAAASSAATAVVSVDTVGTSEQGQEVSCSGDVLALDIVFLAILRAIAPDDFTYRTAKNVLCDVRHVFSSLGMSVEVYGSWVTGSLTPSSDLDLVALPADPPLNSEGVQQEHKDGTRERSKRAALERFFRCKDAQEMTQKERKALYAPLLRNVSKGIAKSRMFYKINQIKHARVPILKAIHHCGIPVDISFQKDGLATSTFICEEFKKPEFRLARGLAILFKALVASWDLDDPSRGGLGSFPITIMVLWFLDAVASEECPSELRGSYAVCFVGLLKYYAMRFDYTHNGIDYCGRRLVTKEPEPRLFILNPLSRSINCAVSANQFIPKILPKLREACNTLQPFLDYGCDLASVESAVLRLFHQSIVRGRFMERYRQELCMGDTRSITDMSPQHVWDKQTNLYLGRSTGI